MGISEYAGYLETGKAFVIKGAEIFVPISKFFRVWQGVSYQVAKEFSIG